MAEDKKTQVEDPVKDTKNEDSYEQRYKDLQSHSTKADQENAALKESAVKDKELFEAVQPYIDWDAVNGTKKTDTVDDDGYVDKKTLNSTIKDLREQMNRDRVTQSFRVKYPDMIQHEDLVAMYIGKTDPRRSTDERIEKAVELTKNLIESERTKGREEFETGKKEKKAKEAEASGLSEGKGPEGTKDEPEGETLKEYLAFRKAQANKQWAPDPSLRKA